MTTRQGGFSLLEILVAFAILSVSLGILLRIFGGAGQIAATADEYSRAIAVAETMYAQLGIEVPLQPGESHGEVDENYRWTLRVEPYPVDESLQGAQQGHKPYWVELSVEWGGEEDPRAFDLHTLRMLPDVPRGRVR